MPPKTQFGTQNEMSFEEGDALKMAALNGTVPASTIVAAEYGDGNFHRTVLTITALSIATTDNTTAGANGSAKIYDFPAGNIVIFGATTNLTTAKGAGGLSATAALVAAVGTVAAANDNGTLTSTEANIVPSTTATLAASVGTANGESTAGTTIDGTATAVDVYLNFAVPDAGTSANDTLTVTGTVTILWANAGDN